MKEMKREDMVGQHLSNFTFIKVLGAGAWATVYEAVDDRNKSVVAIKVIPKQLMRDTPKLEELVKTEIRVLKSCKNENVISFISNFKSDKSIFIATQFCNGGDLENYLNKKKSLSEDEATTFLKQILNGFKGLHEVGAMHRDFKVANVLIHNSVCKIADLGFAKQLEKQQMAKTILGTSLTMAPEVLEEKAYGFEADIWSIGVVYYQMLFGKYPYMGMNDFDILKKIKSNRPDFSRMNISSDARDFIDRCLTVDPKKRISWAEIYEHPLLGKKDAGFIYGTLKSKISMNGNMNFYRNTKLPEKNIYPDIGKEILEVEFEDVGGDIQKSSNMNQLLEEVYGQREKEKAFQVFEKAYLNRRNDYMFVHKFVSPYVTYFNHIKANHGIALFIMSKKAFLDIRQLGADMKARKNIFKFHQYFEEFTASLTYKNILDQVLSDQEMAQIQTISYSSDIDMCSKAISAEFDVEKVASSDFNKLVNETVEQYWYLLAESLGSVKGKSKENLIRVLQALFYYKSSSKTEAEEFDRMMTVIDYEDAEKDIMMKWSQAFS